jgi:hypothetical protein
MEMSLAKKVRSWNPFKKLRSQKKLVNEPDFDLGSEISSVHSDVNSIYSKRTPSTLAFSELERSTGSYSPRFYDHTLDTDKVGFPGEEALAQVKRVLDLKENDTQTTHDGTIDTYESEAGTEAVFVRNSLDDGSSHADDNDDDEDKELRKESTNDGEQIGRQISRETEVLDKMTVIAPPEGQIEDSEGIAMPSVVNSQESDVNDAEVNKVVDRRGPRGQIQYSEDETKTLESGRFDTAGKKSLTSKKNHRGKSLIERESDEMKFEKFGPGGQICYLDEDSSSCSEDTDSDSSTSSVVAGLLTDSFATETEQNSTVNYEGKGGSCCFLCNED